MTRQFFYEVPFPEIRNYLAVLGFAIEPVYRGEDFQHWYKVGNTTLGIGLDIIGVHPVTEDLITTGVGKRVFLSHKTDYKTYQRSYDPTDLKLYLKLYRRFAKPKKL
jgi:hypothetical protein